MESGSSVNMERVNSKRSTRDSAPKATGSCGIIVREMMSVNRQRSSTNDSGRPANCELPGLHNSRFRKSVNFPICNTLLMVSDDSKKKNRRTAAGSVVI